MEEFKIHVPQATRQGYIECPVNGVFDWAYPSSKFRRGRVQGGGRISPAFSATNMSIYLVTKERRNKMNQSKKEIIDTINNLKPNEYIRIRKLTVKEVGRLMDVRDEDIDKMTAVNSRSQMYKQFGNSIVVSCMVGLFENLFYGDRKPKEPSKPVQLSLF